MKNRNISLDILKLFMSLMVVALHANFLADLNSTASYLLVNGAFRIAVPVFLLINGFYFYDVVEKKESFSWFKRVTLLYVFWTIVYIYFWFPAFSDFLYAVVTVFKVLVLGHFHLWYLSGMLLAAGITLVIKEFRLKVVFLILLATSFTGVAIQYLGNYHVFDGETLDEIFNTHYSHRNGLLFSLPFFFIGFLIAKHSLHSKIRYRTALLYSVAGLILLLVESYLNYNNPHRTGGFDNYMALFIVCPALFILVTKTNIYNQSKVLSLYSSGIYFTHILFLSVCLKLTDFGSVMVTLTCSAGAIFITYFLIKIQQKFRYIL